MNFLQLTFYYRILLLVLFLSAISLLDYRKHGTGATKWRECLYICTIGLFGAVYAILIDFVTSSISKHYFIIGKGIQDNSSFFNNVILQGMEAGFIGDLVGACILVYANNPKPNEPSLPYIQLSFQLWLPILLSLLLGILSGLSVYNLFPIEHFTFYQGVLSKKEALRFVTVWGTHIGIYIGAILGFVMGGYRVYRQRAEKKPE